MAPVNATPVDPEAVVGTWALTAFEITFSDGRAPAFPFGLSPAGQIVYSADGHMSAVLMDPSRAGLGQHSLEDARHADEAAKAAAFDSYLSYAGRYELDGDQMAHHIDFSLVPEMVGQTVHRAVRIEQEGAVLVLSYRVPRRSDPSQMRTHSLFWKRPVTGAGAGGSPAEQKR